MLISLMTLTSGPIVYGQGLSKGWQEAKSVSENFKAISSQHDIEVFSAPNVIMIKVNKPSQVRLFTILGKLLSEQHLEPGVYQYRVETHGIYLIKTDDSSCKIAI